MIEKPTVIKINGKEVPLWCDIYALNEIQEEYGTISEFERKLAGIKEVEKDGKKNVYSVEPDIKTLIFGLKLMVKEGYKKEKMLGEEREPVDAEELVMDINIPFTRLADILHKEFRRCFSAKK